MLLAAADAPDPCHASVVTLWASSASPKALADPCTILSVPRRLVTLTAKGVKPSLHDITLEKPMTSDKHTIKVGCRRGEGCSSRVEMEQEAD